MFVRQPNDAAVSIDEKVSLDTGGAGGGACGTPGCDRKISDDDGDCCWQKGMNHISILDLYQMFSYSPLCSRCSHVRS